MKLSFLLFGLAALTASALPAPAPAPNAVAIPEPIDLAVLHEIQKRQLEKRQIVTIRNDLSGPCKAVTVIFARGTLEPGNVGDLAGPEFFDALDAFIGSSNVAVQGVDYGATIPGYLEGGDPAGAATLASLTNQAASQCPSTQIVLSGYSQGAQVVHLGVQQISAAVAARVNAVVLFGDPDDNQPLQNIPAGEVDTYCLPGDLICLGEPIVLPAHLSYSIEAIPAAQFVAARVTV